MFAAAHYARLGLSEIRRKVLEGGRLTRADGETLFACPDLLAIGALAHHRRMRLHGLRTFFVRNRQINYSNLCDTGCLFCAFGRGQGRKGAFTLSRDDVIAKALDDGGHPFAEIHLVGGCHPTLTLDWFEDLFRALRELRPAAVIKALTVTEVAHMAALHGCGTRDVLLRLQKAGVQMLTGGGAEIFAPAVRKQICPKKMPGSEYLRIAGEAHALGLSSNCSMLFGHVESPADRVDHLIALREQQDKSHGFLCFIPLPFQAENNPLAKLLERQERSPMVDAGLDRLRAIAVSRLMLDNIPHIKAYWVMLGIKLAQAALSFGADDLDGTIEEEYIGRMAGADAAQTLTRLQLETMIRGCGFLPVNRDALFRQPKGDGTSAAPSLSVAETPAYAASSRQALSREPCAKPSPQAADLIRRLRAAYAALPDAAPSTPREIDPDRRLNRREAALLYQEADLFTLGALAHQARLALHPDSVVTYVADRNINYSNICACGCRFCAFHRPPGHPRGFVLSREDLDRKLRETVSLGGNQILLQGGHNPELPLAFYEQMLAWIRRDYPDLHIHAFSPPEILFFAQREGLDVDAILSRLIAAGLASIPGGGAEILVDRVREKVSPNKCSAQSWLEIMAKAHRRGLKTTATMMFGHEEDDGERLDHLFAIRGQQDATGGFTAFIPWTFQPANTAIRRPPETAQAYLRMLAVSRLVLDNVPNLQVSWVTMGPQVAQLALFFGANDFGSLMIEENVVAAAGVSFRLNRRQIHHIIRQAGFIPRQRLMDYTPVEEDV
jgi:dehypoxanthine futalosine cyclase/putative menaquinone biosynthesis radical SAM enzyme